MKDIQQRYGFSTHFPKDLKHDFNAAIQYIDAVFPLSPIVGGVYQNDDGSWDMEALNRGLEKYGRMQRNFTPGQSFVYQLLHLWEPSIHGYTQDDFYRFVDFVHETIEHFSQHERRYEVLKNFANIFQHSDTSWRFVAASLQKEVNVAFLLPKTADIVWGYDTTVQSSQDLFVHFQQNTEEFINSQKHSNRNFLYFSLISDMTNPLAHVLKHNMALSWDDFVKTLEGKPLKLNYIRAIELNEFFNTAADDETFQHFLDNNTEYQQHVWSLTFRRLSQHSSDLIESLIKYDMPKFLNLEEQYKNGTGVQKLLASLTKEQYIELYTHYTKKPSIVRTDAKSQTLKYVQEFLDEFFKEESFLDSVKTLEPKEARRKLLELIMSTDSDELIHIADAVGVFHLRHDTYRGPEALLEMFFSNYHSGMQFTDENFASLVLFSVLYGNDGKNFQDFSMIDMMFFAHALIDNRHFVHDKSAVDNTVTMMAKAVLEGKVAAHGVIAFIVEAMKNDAEVPVVHDMEDITNYLHGENPVEWVMPLFQTRKRAIKLPPLVAAIDESRR